MSLIHTFLIPILTSVGLGYGSISPHQQLPISVRELVANEHTCGASVLGTAAVDVIDRSPVVTVLANGLSLRLLFDTGAQRSTITEATARQIGARTPRVQFQRGLHSVAAAMASREAELDSFSIAEIQIPWPRLAVAPISIAQPRLTDLDGVLGADILDRFDTDLDPVRGRVTLYPRGTCATGKPNWATVEIHVGRSAYTDHLFFPVKLDGHQIVAVLDTGAQRTVVSKSLARRLGLTDKALHLDPPFRMRGAAGEALPSFLHRFTRLEIGTISINNPLLVITEVQLTEGDIVLGMDFLATRRLWLSPASFRVFFSDPRL